MLRHYNVWFFLSSHHHIWLLDESLLQLSTGFSIIVFCLFFFQFWSFWGNSLTIRKNNLNLLALVKSPKDKSTKSQSSIADLTGFNDLVNSRGIIMEERFTFPDRLWVFLPDEHGWLLFGVSLQWLMVSLVSQWWLLSDVFQTICLFDWNVNIAILKRMTFVLEACEHSLLPSVLRLQYWKYIRNGQSHQ